MSAMYWAIWLCHNNVIFDKLSILSFIQVVFRGHIGLTSVATTEGGGTSQDEDDTHIA